MSIITVSTPEELPPIPDDYFPDADALGVMGTFKCPVCSSKAFMVVPYEHARFFELALTGKSSDKEMIDALAILIQYVDKNMGYLTHEERLRIVSGVCSMECELQWVDTLY